MNLVPVTDPLQLISSHLESIAASLFWIRLAAIVIALKLVMGTIRMRDS